MEPCDEQSRSEADLILVHAPAFFDFRDRRDIYFPYMSTSGDVPITPLYEYYPVGFRTLQRSLGAAGYRVQILNLASLLVAQPEISVPQLIRSLNAPLIGIDLHWMVHVQGSLAIAKLLSELRPDVKVIFGGISSTYYARELVLQPGVCMVMRGYETHAPMEKLLGCLGNESAMRGVENLLWKNSSGEIVDNGFSHNPTSFSCGIDWSRMPDTGGATGLQTTELLSTQNAGCPYNCGWCGGSRDAFRRINGVRHVIARKPMKETQWELDTVRQGAGTGQGYHFYAVGSYTETRSRMAAFMKKVEETNFRSVSYEQFHLPSDDTLKEMVAANPRTTITLSPESHDMRVSKLAGRGNYSPEEMEKWLARALDAGIHRIDIWYFIGMPEQDEASVLANVDYCARLLRQFPGGRVVPFLCPMIPFLDPASNFFEKPKEHGYRIFYRSLEEHRRGMERASIINRINYETRWLSRENLVYVGYRALHELAGIKRDHGVYPGGVALSVQRKLADTLEFIKAVHSVDCIADPDLRRRELDGLGTEIQARNTEVFHGGVSNQAFPVERQGRGRWFDDLALGQEMPSIS